MRISKSRLKLNGKKLDRPSGKPQSWRKNGRQKKSILRETLQKTGVIESDLEKSREKVLSIEQQLTRVRERLSSNENKLWLLKKLDKDRTSFQIGSEELLNNPSLQKILPGTIFSKYPLPKFRALSKLFWVRRSSGYWPRMRNRRSGPLIFLKRSARGGPLFFR